MNVTEDCRTVVVVPGCCWPLLSIMLLSWLRTICCLLFRVNRTVARYSCSEIVIALYFAHGFILFLYVINSKRFSGRPPSYLFENFRHGVCLWRVWPPLALLDRFPESTPNANCENKPKFLTFSTWDTSTKYASFTIHLLTDSLILSTVYY